MTFSSLQLMLLVWCGLVQEDAPKNIDPVWLARAKTEIRPSLERYRSLSRLIDETSVIRIEKNPSAGASTFRNRTIELRCSQLNNNSVSETVTTFDDEKEKPIIRVDCTNENYRFSLQKSRPDAAYVLTSYKSVEPGDRVSWAGGGYMNVFDAMPHVLGAVDGLDGHVLKAMHWDDSRQLLYIRLDVKRGSATKPFIADEEIWTDPINNWRTLEVKVRAPFETTQYQMTYGTPIDGLSFPAHYTQTTVPSDTEKPPYTTRGSYKVSKTTRSALDFRLAAFGLPEPVEFPQKKRIPTYVWILVAAGACVVLGIGLRYLARRKHLRTVA
jgi:hypothetical protein